METLLKIRSDVVRNSLARAKSEHQVRVESMIRGIKGRLPNSPSLITKSDRALCARLIFEEAMETINALSVEVTVDGKTVNPECRELTHVKLATHSTRPMDFDEVVDGCLDTRVVATYTLSIMGVADAMLQEEVDNNNNLKFSEGHYIDEGGKLIKPKDHPKPRIGQLLAMQRNAVRTDDPVPV